MENYENTFHNIPNEAHWYYKCYYSFLQIQSNLEWIDLATKSSFYFRMEGVRRCTPYIYTRRKVYVWGFFGGNMRQLYTYVFNFNAWCGVHTHVVMVGGRKWLTIDLLFSFLRKEASKLILKA